MSTKDLLTDEDKKNIQKQYKYKTIFIHIIFWSLTLLNILQDMFNLHFLYILVILLTCLTVAHIVNINASFFSGWSFDSFAKKMHPKNQCIRNENLINFSSLDFRNKKISTQIIYLLITLISFNSLFFYKNLDLELMIMNSLILTLFWFVLNIMDPINLKINKIFLNDKKEGQTKRLLNILILCLKQIRNKAWVDALISAAIYGLLYFIINKYLPKSFKDHEIGYYSIVISVFFGFRSFINNITKAEKLHINEVLNMNNIDIKCKNIITEDTKEDYKLKITFHYPAPFDTIPFIKIKSFEYTKELLGFQNDPEIIISKIDKNSAYFHLNVPGVKTFLDKQSLSINAIFKDIEIHISTSHLTYFKELKEIGIGSEV